jgi:hypothetical protein
MKNNEISYDTISEAFSSLTVQEMSNAYDIFFGNPEGNRPLGRPEF